MGAVTVGIRITHHTLTGQVRRRVVAIVTAAALTLTGVAGCTSTIGGEGSPVPDPAAMPSTGTAHGSTPIGKGDNDTSSAGLYLGAIPTPAPLTAFAASEMPAVPEPPTDPTDESAMADYQRELEEYAAAMGDFGSESVGFTEEVDRLAEATRAGGEEAVAAWQSLLVAAGIAVGLGEEAVEVDGMTGSGVPMPLEELRLQEVIGTSQARMYLTDLADVLDGAGFRISAEELREELNYVEDEAFAIVLLALNPDGHTFVDESTPNYDDIPTAEVTLTPAQVSIVIRRLAVELAMSDPDAEFEPEAPGLRSTAHPATVPSPRDLSGAAADLCKPGDEWWKDQLRKDARWVEDELFGKMKKGQDLDTQEGLTKFQAAQAAVAIVSLLAKIFMLEADFALDNSPLVRTKDRSPGERRDLIVTLGYPETALKDVHECIARLLTQIGINLADFQGPAKGVDVDLSLKGNRLQYARGSAGTGAYRQKADDNGKVVFPLEGRAQPNRLPDGAEPKEVTSPIRADANLKGSDLFKDLRDAANDARSGILAVVIGALERMKLLTFAWEVPVRDWTLEAEFDMTLRGVVSAHQAENRRIPGLYGCPDSTSFGSSSALGQMSGKPHRVTATYLTAENGGETYSTLLIHTKGRSIDDLVTHQNGTELAHIEFDYGITIQKDAKAQEPIPAPYTDSGAGCGDGDGTGVNIAPDCGERSFMGMGTVTRLSDILYVTVDHLVGQKWQHCKLPLAPTVEDVVSPPQSLELCRNAYLDKGEIPSVDTVFSDTNYFEIEGELRCSYDGRGSLQRFTFDWTLEFCRIVDGERAC